MLKALSKTPARQSLCKGETQKPGGFATDQESAERLRGNSMGRKKRHSIK